MASVGYLLGPVLVLLGSWSLLRWYDGSDRTSLRLGLGCLAAAIAVTGAAVAFDDQSPPPPPSRSLPDV